MRIIVLSNGMHVKTGYGVQCNLFIPRLQKAGYEMAMCAYFGIEGAAMNYNGVMTFPRGNINPYGMDVIGAHAANWKADAIFTLMDTWVVTPASFKPFKWIAWYPIDHEPIPPKVREAISQAEFRIAMSKFGVEETHKAGLDCYYIPHGVDTELYKPIDKIEARERLHLPKDAYIVGTVAMNKGIPSRKNMTQMIKAFAKFKQRHTNAIYYIHTQEGINKDGLGGVNIPEICNLLGLQYGKDVILPDPYGMLLGFSDELMANIYSAMDVHLLVSMGEGFGIPIIEAQACGCPVIVGGWTAMPELVHSGRIIDKKDAIDYFTAIAADQWIPSTRAIELALEAEYKNPSPRERARKGMVENYDANLVFEKHFLPTMQDIEKRMRGEVERFAQVAEVRK